MPRKTKGIETQVKNILLSNKNPISAHDITIKILGEEDPRITIYNQTNMLIRYHLKQLIHQELVIKEKFKNGYIYKINRGKKN